MLLRHVLTRELRKVLHDDARTIRVEDGHVRLEDVRLRCNVLHQLLAQELGLSAPPVQIVMVHVGLLSISIPWGDWSQGFTEITLDGLSVLLASRTKPLEATEVQQQKEATVRRAMERIIASHQQERSKSGVFDELGATLLRNLLAHCRPRVHISRIHLRYEQQPLSAAVGVTLRGCDLVHADDGFGPLVSELALQLSDAASYVHLRSERLSSGAKVGGGAQGGGAQGGAAPSGAKGGAAIEGAEERRVARRMQSVFTADGSDGGPLDGDSGWLVGPACCAGRVFLNLGCFFGGALQHALPSVTSSSYPTPLHAAVPASLPPAQPERRACSSAGREKKAFRLPVASASLTMSPALTLDITAHQLTTLSNIATWHAATPLREIYALNRPPAPFSRRAAPSYWRAATGAIRMARLRDPSMAVFLAAKAQVRDVRGGL